MEPIRVLHVVGNMDAGGLETLIMNWYRNIDRESVQFDFLVLTAQKGYYEDEILSMGGKVYHLSLKEDKNFLKYFGDLRRFFAEHKEYSAVHGHHASLGRFYLRAARRSGVPYCISHSHIAAFPKSPIGLARRILANRYGKEATHQFACSVAAGEYMYGKKAAFRVINNGIDTRKFAFSSSVREEKRKELGLEGKKVLVHVGRFHEQKNHTFLIDVFEQICQKEKDAVLLLVGVGPLMESIKQKVGELELEDKICFMGNRSDVNEILCAADLFLFPSLYEGLPLTLVEAQSSGLSIVCSDTVTSETKLTEHYYAYSLTDPAQKWAEAVCNILKKEVLREGADALVREKRYDCRDIAEEMKTFYLSAKK